MTALLLLIPAGLLLGVLINYLADVLPYTRRLSAPVCAFCGTTLDWGTYLGFYKCPECGHGRRARAWIVPLLSAALVSLFWFYPPKYLNFWVGAALLAYFGLVAITDLEYHAILNPVSLAGVAIGLWAGVVRHPPFSISTDSGLPGWVVILAGGAFGFAVMLLLYYLGRAYGRYLSRRRGVPVEDEEALGFGDVYMTGIIGLILGWPAITAGLFLAIVLAGAVGGAFLLYGLITKRFQAGTSFLPYAPFLVIAAVILLYPPW